jgi:4-carboxymuconolactone decarboxylase
MKPFRILLGLLVASGLSAAGYQGLGRTGQEPSGRNRRATVESEETLPTDISPDSRNRLPLIRREDLDDRGKKAYDAAVASSNSGSGVPQGAAEIRLHATGVDVRWASPLGRQLTELAILTTAREMDQPYEWSLHEMEALSLGADPKVIDVVRYRKASNGLGEKEIVTIEVGRQIFGKHRLSAATFASALKIFGEANLVDIIDLMGQYSGTAARLTAFNQHLPPQMKQFLPLPLTLPDDIHPDSRSRLPIIRTQNQNPQAPPALYSRSLEPEGTGPAQIARHAAGFKSLEASVGRRLIDLAALVTAREYDEQFGWTMNELAARQDGLEPAIIDAVRERKPLTGLGEKEAVTVEFGRELFGKHLVTAETYAHALNVFGERDLVDFVAWMAQNSRDNAVLIGFDQHLPAGQKPLLPEH